MSIDGYLAGPGESGFELLFQWYGNSDVETPPGNPDYTLRTSATSAAHLARLYESTGALLVGRRLYDMTNGRLQDEVHIDLVPGLLGDGTPFFSRLGLKPVQLEGPISGVEETGVTHIAYAVRKDQP